MPDRPLTDLSVTEFIGAVASAKQPVPAGGSVAALTGAASAALLALVADVIERHKPGVLAEVRQMARDLQQQLLELVEEDAAAFRAFLDADRDSQARVLAAPRAAIVPVDIGRACARIPELARAAEPHVSPAMQLDLGAARNMAAAAARSALDIAEHNLDQVSDASMREGLQRDIDQLRKGV
jgi:methenyltetrahydrofolate cyclohydrolase